MTEKDGVIYYDEPMVVDYLAFLYAHLDCDVILKKDYDKTYEKAYIVACAASKDKNEVLWKVFYDKYNTGEYLIGDSISREQMNAIY